MYFNKEIFHSEFYYKSLLKLIAIVTIFSDFVTKLSIALNLNVWGGLIYLKALFYSFVFFSCLLTSMIFWGRIKSLYIFYCSLIIMISIIHEFNNYLIMSPDYGLLDSIINGRLNITFRTTLPFIFLAVLHSFEGFKEWGVKFYDLIGRIVLINSVCICVGIILNISVFESYIGSGRWGYSGFLVRGYSVVLSTIYLIDILSNKKINLLKSLVLGFAILCSGTKAGLLSLVLIFFIVIIRNYKYRFWALSLSLLNIIVFAPKIISYFINFSEFWNNVYLNHGGWGVFFSLRNENVFEFIDFITKNYDLKNWLIGIGNGFNEIWVEILPIDYFAWFGIVGLICFTKIFRYLIPSLKFSIPLFIAFGSGALLFGPLMICLWSISILKNNNE